jgi:hypothetical protein
VCPATRVQTVIGADLLDTRRCADIDLCPLKLLGYPSSGSEGRAKPDILYTDNCMITDLTISVSGTIVDDPEEASPGPGDLGGNGVRLLWSWAFSGPLGGSPIPVELARANPGAVSGSDIGATEGCDVAFDDSFTGAFPSGGPPFAGQYGPNDPIADQLVAVNGAQANSDIVVLLSPSGISTPTGDILLIDCIGITATLVQM